MCRSTSSRRASPSNCFFGGSRCICASRRCSTYDRTPLAPNTPTARSFIFPPAWQRNVTVTASVVPVADYILRMRKGDRLHDIRRLNAYPMFDLSWNRSRRFVVSATDSSAIRDGCRTPLRLRSPRHLSDLGTDCLTIVRVTLSTSLLISASSRLRSSYRVYASRPTR